MPTQQKADQMTVEQEARCAWIRSFIEEGARLEATGRALTPEEAQIVQAATFLRQIAPWVLTDEPAMSDRKPM